MSSSRSSSEEERVYIASQWQLMRRKFFKHKLAILGMIVLAFLYGVSIFCEFFSPYGTLERHQEYLYCKPHKVRFFDEQGKFHMRPFVYAYRKEFDQETWITTYTEDTSRKYDIRFFVRGGTYKFWSLFEADIRFFGVEEPGKIFLFGTDKLGRDLFSRNLHATRISLSIGLVGIMVSFVLGCIFGGISGYYGGKIDTIIQRIIEFILSIPTIPLWMALSAALPVEWPPVKVYFGITIILSLRGWCGLARVVRGKLLELREEDFVMAAKITGLRERSIIARHLLPSFASYLIVNITLAVPHMILGETSLSFLGLGLRSPVVSWGTLMQDAQNVRSVVMHPWLLIPGLLVIVTTLAYNFLGDGLRDAADPYKQ